MAYVLAVDVGTTFTAAAVSRDGRPEIVSLGTHQMEIPSVVFLQEDGEFVVGEAAQRQGLHQPTRVAREFKRRMGDSTPLMLGMTPVSAHALTSKVIRSVVSLVADRQGEP